MGRPSDALDRLIQAAIDLIWPSSYGAVGVDAICERAGVKKGSFYHFFPSKDALVVAALEWQWGDRRQKLDALFSPSLPPLARLEGYFAHVRERQSLMRKKYGRVVGCFHNTLASECIHSPPEVAAALHTILVGYVRYFETTLRDAKADGLTKRRDPAEDAKMLFAFVSGALVQSRIHDDLARLTRLADDSFALVGLSRASAA